MQPNSSISSFELSPEIKTGKNLFVYELEVNWLLFTFVVAVETWLVITLYKITQTIVAFR